MGNQEDEIKRLMRLRDQQVQRRDPLTKNRELHARITRGQRKKQFTMDAFSQDVANLPHKIHGAAIGGVIGLVIMIVMVVAIDETWAGPIGLIIALSLALIGFVFGVAFDWKRDVSDLD